MARNLADHGVNLAFPTLREVRSRLRLESERQADRRGAIDRQGREYSTFVEPHA